MPASVAIFDFDDTLVEKDSFWLYLFLVAGRFASYLILGEALLRYILKKAVGRPSNTDFRTFIKAHLLHRLLVGKKEERLRTTARLMAGKQKRIHATLQALKEHKEKGAVIVIASGGLDLYLPSLLRDIPYDALICTEIGVENGVITGEMVKGNCVRARKAERVAAWLAAHGPFEESFGYGNYPDDLPMLALVRHRILVS